MSHGNSKWWRKNVKITRTVRFISISARRHHRNRSRLQHGHLCVITSNTRCLFVLYFRKICMQNLNPRIQLCVPREPNHPRIDFTIDCCMWNSEWWSVLLQWNHTRLPVLRESACVQVKRFCGTWNGMGMATLASITNMDHTPHLDTEMWTFGHNRKIVRQSHVQRSIDRSVNGIESKTRRSSWC